MITTPGGSQVVADALGAHNIFWDAPSHTFIREGTQEWEKFLIEEDIKDGKIKGVSIQFERTGQEVEFPQGAPAREESSMADEADFETDEDFDSTFTVKRPSSAASEDLF